MSNAAMKIIGLLSDFGLRDSYVAEMKAVILSICPEARLLDISHEIRKFDIRMGAFVLASAAASFPEGAIYLAVVDPGVGSKRLPLIVESKRSLYVGPDNGLLMLAALREGIRYVHRIDDQKYLGPAASATFHGRDLFAHVVGDLANGVRPCDIGSPVRNYVKPEFGEPIISAHSIRCKVLHVDDFGNIVTNVDATDLEKVSITLESSLVLEAGHRRLRPRFVRAYAEIPEAAVGCLIGSHGFLEIAMRMRSASKAIRVTPGSKLTIRSLKRSYPTH